jgi:hypothetical protein
MEILIWTCLIGVVVAVGQTSLFLYRSLGAQKEQEIALNRWSAVSPGDIAGSERERAQLIAAMRACDATYRPVILTFCADIIALIVICGFEWTRVRQRTEDPKHPGSMFARFVMTAACLFAAIAPWIAKETLPW